METNYSDNEEFENSEKLSDLYLNNVKGSWYPTNHLSKDECD